MMTSLSNAISALWPEPLRLVLFVVGIMSFVGANAAYLVWVERKGAARFQRRPGPTEVGWAGLLQPIADAAKLMSKQLIVPAGVDRTLFRVAPLLMMSPVLMSLAVIPWGQSLAARNINVGLLMIFAFGSVNVMAIMLGGWSSRNKYAIISAARVVSQNVAYEIPMLLVVITMIMVTGTMNLNEIVVQQAGGFWHWNFFRVWVNPLAPVTFLIFLVGDALPLRDHHAHAFQQRGVALDEFVFIAFDLRVPLHHFVKLLGVPRAEPCHADDTEPVGAHVRHFVGDVHVHTMDERGDGDQRGGGQNNAEQRQETAQLVLVQ